jgi:large subunit ribosomal protein L2
MAKKFKPTTPSRRHMSVVDFKKYLTVSEPFKPLLVSLKKHSARNNKGRITMRHRGGGHKKLYRLIDFKQDKMGVSGRIETIEYDPYRNAFISLVLDKDGERRYILTAEGMKVGDEVITNEKTEIKLGHRLRLRNIPVGTEVHNVEIFPGQGGKCIRSAGSSATVMGVEGKYAILKFPSSEVRKILADCFATIGSVSNSEFRTITIGKAGRKRWLGRRPVVRGSAMNPVDHPYGGGEGRSPRGTKRPKTKWGKVTGGRKTRKKKKWSNKLIIKRRKTKR